MDLETENRIAAILLKEAAELRSQAQKEGALAYLHRPTLRSRPNSRFLTATVRGVQQANRAVEVNEMWRLREKQLELDNRLKTRNEGSSMRGYKDVSESRSSRNRGGNEVETSSSASFPSKKRWIHGLHPIEDEGLRDDEVDEFLHSRTKRGRGSVGSRMDETGPYLSCPDSEISISGSGIPDGEQKRARVVLGPEKPDSLKSSELSDYESSQDKKKRAKIDSSKRHSSKHKSNDKLKDKKKKRKKEMKRKHHR